MASTRILSAALALALCVAPAAGQKSEGRKQDGGRGKPAAAQQQQQQQAKRQGGPPAKAERGRPAAAPGNSGKASAKAGNGSGKGNAPAAKARGASKQEARAYRDRLPQGFRAIATSRRATDRMVVGAAAYGASHGLDPDGLRLRVVDDRLEIRNRDDGLLFDMNEDRARRLGSWELQSLGDREVRDGAPAFCRSGEGHPVWGREWCLDKGFGLGRSNDRYWARTRVEDIIFGRRIEQDRLDRGSLIDILGDVVFGRLALHALALGFDQPLIGTYSYQPDAPRIVRVYSASEPVAELVDLNGDDRVDLLYVTHY
jgi:hypothetical protein